MGAVSFAIVLCLGAVMPGAARAQDVAPAGAILAFDAADGCPAESELILEVERILERPWAELPSELSIAIFITRPEPGAAFVLEIALGEGTRTLRDVQCEALVHAAALIVALAVDADRAILGAATPPPPPPPAPPVEASGRDLPAPFDPTPPLGPPPPLGIGVGIQLDIGLLPQPSAGPVLEGVLRIDAFDVRLRVGYLAPSSLRRMDGIGAEVSAVVGALHGCVRPLAEPRLAVCGGLEGGGLVAQALGPVSRPLPGQQVGPWLAVGAGLWLPWTPWDALDLELSLEGFVSLLRPTFLIAGLGPTDTVFEPFPAGARIGLVIHLDLRP